MKQCGSKVILCVAVFLLINNLVLALPTPVDDTNSMSSSVSNLFGKVKNSVTSGAKKVQTSVAGAASTVSDSVVDGYEYVKTIFTDSKKVTTTTKSPTTTTLRTVQENKLEPVVPNVSPDPIIQDSSVVDFANVTALATESLPDQKKAEPKSLEPAVTVGTPVLVSTTAKSDVRKVNDAIVFVDEDENVVDQKFLNTPDESLPTEAEIETTTDITDNRHVFDLPINCAAGKKPVNGNCRKIV